MVVVAVAGHRVVAKTDKLVASNWNSLDTATATGSEAAAAADADAQQEY